MRANTVRSMLVVLMVALAAAVSVRAGLDADAIAGAPEEVHGMVAETPRPGERFLDFAALARRSSPNDRLVAPPGATVAAADAPAPVFAVGPEAVAEAWQDVVMAQPRTEIVAVSADGLAVEAVQRSRVFGFVDLVSMRTVPLGPGRSSLAVYSRSVDGWWDLGVNARRLDSWIAALRERLPVIEPN